MVSALRFARVDGTRRKPPTVRSTAEATPARTSPNPRVKRPMARLSSRLTPHANNRITAIVAGEDERQPGLSHSSGSHDRAGPPADGSERRPLQASHDGSTTVQASLIPLIGFTPAEIGDLESTGLIPSGDIGC